MTTLMIVLLISSATRGEMDTMVGGVTLLGASVRIGARLQ